MKNLIVGIIVVGVIGGIGFVIYQNNAAPGEYDELAQCLTDRGVKMYGAYWCSACQQQKREFGKSFKFVDNVECSLPNRGGQTELCKKEEITSYPTWEFQDGERAVGVFSLRKLAEKAGCEL